MKRTFIFRAIDPELSQTRLQRLVDALQIGRVSWKSTRNGDKWVSVQVFVDSPSMYHLLFRAGFCAEAWDDAIREARRRGDMAVARASKRLDKLRRATEVSNIDDAQFLKNLSRLKRLQMPGGTKRSKRSA